MPDPDSSDDWLAASPAAWPEAERTADWSLVLDRLISWAVSQGDAVADQLYDYLAQRSVERQPGGRTT